MRWFRKRKEEFEYTPEEMEIVERAKKIPRSIPTGDVRPMIRRLTEIEEKMRRDNEYPG